MELDGIDLLSDSDRELHTVLCGIEAAYTVRVAVNSIVSCFDLVIVIRRKLNEVKCSVGFRDIGADHESICIFSLNGRSFERMPGLVVHLAMDDAGCLCADTKRENESRKRGSQRITEAAVQKNAHQGYCSVLNHRAIVIALLLGRLPRNNSLADCIQNDFRGVVQT